VAAKIFLKEMEIRHLNYFLKVAEELNFSKAAEKLFISQPPLSRQIKELENELGARLFDRSNKKVNLTNAGKYFEIEIKSLLDSLDRIKLQTRKIAENVSGEFRIAYIGSTFSGIITELIKHLTEIYPYANFKLFEIGSARQIQELEQGKLDLGILRAPLQSRHINSQLWFRDSYAFVYNQKRIKLTYDDELEKLSAETFVFYNKDFAPHYHNTLIEICSLYGFIPNVVHESNNINSLIQLVRNGLGVSIVPSSLEKNHPDSDLKFWKPKRSLHFTEVLLATPVHQESVITKEAISFLLNTIRKK
jgi:DNA-binding transcriptional LysR family regulator